MQTIEVKPILEDMFNFFSISEDKHPFYVSKLQGTIRNANALKDAVNFLIENAKYKPTISEVRTSYYEHLKKQQKPNFEISEIVLTESDNEHCKKFFSIYKNVTKYHQKYNQVCFDNGMDDWLEPTCQAPDMTDILETKNRFRGQVLHGLFSKSGKLLRLIEPNIPDKNTLDEFNQLRVAIEA